MALTRDSILTSNYSTRGSVPVRLIVLHTAEGSRTYQSLGSFFSSSSSGVSSHVGIDDTPNTVGEYVLPQFASWTCAEFNPISVNAELCAFAAWSSAEWSSHPTMLSNLSQWIAEEAARYSIPIVKLTPTQAQTDGRGVCQHSDLGTRGGGHTDCGSNFPIDTVLSAARNDTPTPSPSPIPTPTPSPSPSPTPPLPSLEENVTSYYAGKTHHVYAQRDDGSVDHWWLDTGSANASWRHEVLSQ